VVLQNHQPDFLIIGAPCKWEDRDGVILVASNDLTEAELQERYEAEVDLWSMRVISAAPRLSHVELTAELKSYVIVFGTNYQEAFQKLMSMGDPSTWRAEPQQIQPAMRQLPSGD
jgi:hypothetical protein